MTNWFWLEYLWWLQRIYGSSYPEIVERALPDTASWRNKLAYNEPMVNYYLRHRLTGLPGRRRELVTSASGDLIV